jgi:hypothetical protein
MGGSNFELKNDFKKTCLFSAYSEAKISFLKQIQLHLTPQAIFLGFLGVK